MQVPRRMKINQTYKALIQQLNQSIKDVNLKASTLMAKGNYIGAKEALSLAETITAYINDVKSLKQKLRNLSGTNSNHQQKGEHHKLWEFYVPILQTIEDLDGETNRAELESKFFKSYSQWLKPGDTKTSPKGKPRWKSMIGHSRKAMLQEEYIEMPKRGIWQITAAGRTTIRKKCSES